MDGALPPLARGVQGCFLKEVSVAVACLELHSLMKGVQLVVHSLFGQVPKKLQSARRES